MIYTAFHEKDYEMTTSDVVDIHDDNKCCVILSHKYHIYNSPVEL